MKPPLKRNPSRGFTLLEVLIATAIMAIAVIGLLSALSTSMRNASRLTDHDRIAILARNRMDEILANYDLPLEGRFTGKFGSNLVGDEEAGYEVAMGIFEAPPEPTPGAPVIQRIIMHVWWQSGSSTRSLDLESFRRNRIPRGRL